MRSFMTPISHNDLLLQSKNNIAKAVRDGREDRNHLSPHVQGLSNLNTPSLKHTNTYTNSYSNSIVRPDDTFIETNFHKLNSFNLPYNIQNSNHYIRNYVPTKIDVYEQNDNYSLINPDIFSNTDISMDIYESSNIDEPIHFDDLPNIYDSIEIDIPININETININDSINVNKSINMNTPRNIDEPLNIFAPLNKGTNSSPPINIVIRDYFQPETELYRLNMIDRPATNPTSNNINISVIPVISLDTSSTEPSQIEQKKRNKITHQIDDFKTKWRQHSDKCPSKNHGHLTGISTPSCQMPTDKMKKNISIDKSPIKGGRKRIISDEIIEILTEEVKINSKMKQRDMRLFVARKQLELRGINTQELSEAEIYNQGPNEQTIRHYFSKKNANFSSPLFKLTRHSSDIYPSLNTNPFKYDRINLLNNLQRYVRGNILIYLDMSYWDLSFRDILRTEEEKKLCPSNKDTNINLSVICTASAMDGVGISDIFEGVINLEIFNSFLDRAVQYYQKYKSTENTEQKLVFFIGNSIAPNSEDSEMLMALTNSVMFYNINNSIQMSPIQYIFDFWKIKCENEILSTTSTEKLIDSLSQKFCEISEVDVNQYINYVQSVVWEKIYKMEDI